MRRVAFGGFLSIAAGNTVASVTKEIVKILNRWTRNEFSLLSGCAWIHLRQSDRDGCRVAVKSREPLRRGTSPARTSAANLGPARVPLGADLSGANLSGADLSPRGPLRADLSGAYLSGAGPLRRGPLPREPLRRVTSRRGPLRRNLRQRDLSGGCWTSPSATSAARTSPARTSPARTSPARTSFPRRPLRRAYLSGADLSGANLSGADLSRAGPLRQRNLPARTSPARTVRTVLLPKTRNFCRMALLSDGKNFAMDQSPTSHSEDARRSHAFGRKCRARFVDVIEGEERQQTLMA